MADEKKEKIMYSDKYSDGKYEYRHVHIPKDHGKIQRTLNENEWRSLGIQMSRGWEHYTLHRPEPHILLFRRPLGTDPLTGQVDPILAKQAKEEYIIDLMPFMRE